MASFTAKDVAALRGKTGCGMMDCKKALTESGGDMDAAVDILREKGLAAANKKASRVAAEGVAFAATNEKGNVGAIIEVNAETDFVAKNKDFQKFVNTCLDIIISSNPKDLDELLSLNVPESGLTVEALLRDKILTIGENIKIRRFTRYEGVVSTYVHAGGRIGVMVNFDTDNSTASSDDFKTYAKDIAMQIAAVSPSYLDDKSVPEDVIQHERKILREQVINEGKPEKIADKIVNGKLQKYYKDNCLLNQLFVKDSDITVADYTKKMVESLGASIRIISFVRFETGEGLEKRSDNFADEVAGMVK